MKINYYVFIIMLFLIISISLSVSAYNYNMSWNFRVFNDPDARQVALNIAQIQLDNVVKEADPVDAFQTSFERRLMSTVQRAIIDQIFGEAGITVGEYRVGDLNVSIAEDANTGEVVMEIEDMITGESTIVTYAVDYWLNDEYNFNY